jgi:flagellar biosynthesis protein FlhA
MGGDFGKQFLAYPKAIYLSALTIFFFGLIPGLPHFAFIGLSLVIGGSMYVLNKRKEGLETEAGEDQKAEPVEAGPEPVEHLLMVDPLELEVGYGLIPLVDREHGGRFLDRVRSIRRQFALEMGLVIPPIHIRDNLQLNSSEYQILLKGVKVAGAELLVNHYLAMDPGETTRKIEGIETTEPAFDLPAVWVPEVQREEAKLAGYTVVDDVTIMATHLTEILRKYSAELLGRQEVQSLLDHLSQSYPKAVEELVPNLLSLGATQKVLQNLIQERISIRDLLTIIETLADCAPVTKDPDLLPEYVRPKLSLSIISPYLSEDGLLNLITMTQEVEDLLLNGIQKSDHGGAYLSIDPKVADSIIASIKAEAEKAMAKNIQPILLTSPTVRRHLKKMVEYFIPSLMVLSQSELLGDIGLKSIGEVSLNYAG